MAKRMQKLLIAFAAFAALATGGAVFAQAQTSQTSGSENPAAVDRDHVQSGDQTTPDQPGTVTASHKSAAPTAGTGNGSAANEQPGEQPGSESAANSDGPGGHADAPGNASADHQFQGVE